MVVWSAIPTIVDKNVEGVIRTTFLREKHSALAECFSFLFIFLFLYFIFTFNAMYVILTIVRKTFYKPNKRGKYNELR